MDSLIIKKESERSQKRPLIVSISKAILKKATERNRLRRQLRSIFVPIMKNRGEKIKVIVRKEVLQKTYSDLKKEVTEKLGAR